MTVRLPIRIRPEVGRSSPARQRKQVVLPQPLGPMSTSISDAATWSERVFNAATPPKVLLRFSIRTEALRDVVSRVPCVTLGGAELIACVQPITRLIILSTSASVANFFSLINSRRLDVMRSMCLSLGVLPRDATLASSGLSAPPCKALGP